MQHASAPASRPDERQSGRLGAVSREGQADQDDAYVRRGQQLIGFLGTRRFAGRHELGVLVHQSKQSAAGRFAVGDNGDGDHVKGSEAGFTAFQHGEETCS
jgi:hypothetical protein